MENVVKFKSQKKLNNYLNKLSLINFYLLLIKKLNLNGLIVKLKVISLNQLEMIVMMILMMLKTYNQLENDRK